MDHRFHLVGFDSVLVVFGVKSGIQSARRPGERDPKAMGKGHESRQGCWQNNRIVLVARFDRDRSEHTAMIFHNGQLFVALLVFVAGVAKTWAPFFPTVLEPSPWRTAVSS
jgi:hypothetical protein